MKYLLYFKGQFLGAFTSFEDAEAQSRWSHFEMRSQPWEGYNMPPGYMICCVNDNPLKSQDFKKVCF